MPTGYTAKIKDGISFKEFALDCARNFGACISMRDDPFDKPIPKEFKPSSYYEEKIKKLKKELEIVQRLASREAENRANQEYLESVRCQKKRLQEKRELQRKYERMLVQAKNWKAPSSDHIQLKNFMIKQIEDSIDFDCGIGYENTPDLLTGQEWLDKEIKRIKDDLEYHKKEDEKDKTRISERNLWIRQLRESLLKAEKKEKK